MPAVIVTLTVSNDSSLIGACLHLNTKRIQRATFVVDKGLGESESGV